MQVLRGDDAGDHRDFNRWRPDYLCNGEWLLKKSLQCQKLPKLGDQKCIPRWRTSFIEHPSASSFLCADAERLFQQPRDATTVKLPGYGAK